MNTHTRAPVAAWLRVLLVLLASAVILAGGLLIPWDVALVSHPHPAQSYTEAVQRVAAWHAEREAQMNPDCQIELLTHGQKTQRVIVLVHGYTSCPAQFQELGKQFYDLGYNVLIAPLPHHGLADRLNDEQSQLTADELAAYADQVMDIADGLGGQITIMGISAGGVTSAWAAQNRSDVSLAVIISPAFGFKEIPTPLTAAAMNFYRLKPNSFEWWDPVLQANEPPSHAYPRYSTHALAQTLRLGFAVQDEMQQSAPAAQRIIVVTNASDPSVNNALTGQVVAAWKQHGAHISTYEFPQALGLGHDLIDPAQPNQQTGVVYPELIALATQ